VVRKEHAGVHVTITDSLVYTRDIAVTMLTCDRSPLKNYLSATLDNFKHGGVFSSPRLHSFTLVCTDGAQVWPPKEVIRDRIALDIPLERRFPNQNAARALEIGSRSGAPWVLFTEDDIDVSSRFLDSVGSWLDRFSKFNRRVFSFGANYPRADGPYGAWDYPITDFYGTQCFAIRADDAASLAEFLYANVFAHSGHGNGYDILMHAWAKQRWPTIDYFAASSPSFVQHLGDASVIGSKHFVFPSWPGREWSYV
jgi:hypothetical protein